MAAGEAPGGEQVVLLRRQDVQHAAIPAAILLVVVIPQLAHGLDEGAAGAVGLRPGVVVGEQAAEVPGQRRVDVVSAIAQRRQQPHLGGPVEEGDPRLPAQPLHRRQSPIGLGMAHGLQ